MPIGPNGEALPYPEEAPPGFGGMPFGIGAEPPDTIQVSQEEEAPSAPSDLLRDMLDLAMQYRDSEDDDEDLLQIEKVTTLIQQLLANNQKEADGMMQGKMSPRGLRKALSG